jgi:hypothetical protein
MEGSGAYQSAPEPKRAARAEGDRESRADEAEQRRQEEVVLLDSAAMLQEAFEHQHAWRQYPGFSFAAYGAFENFDVDDSVEFGVIVYAQNEPSDYEFAVDGETVPVDVRIGARYVPAAGKVHPLDGTTTCHARSGRVAATGTTLLTAAHILSPGLITPVSVGDEVQLGSGRGVVVDVGPPAIDAMLVLPHEEELETGSWLEVENRPAPYTSAYVHTSGRVLETTLMSVTDALGTLSPYMPSRLLLADVCRPGDSGSLVTNREGKGIGIYTGRIQDIAGKAVQGVCQHLGQVVHCMNLGLSREETPQ